MLARTVFFVLLGLSVALFSCSKDRPAPVAPAGKSLASLAAPAVPTNLRFDAPTDSSCTVRWDASDGATDYDVNYKPAVGGRWTNEPHRGIGLSNTIDDLQPNTEYRWAVRAENNDGASAWVFGSNFTTLAEETDETTEEEGADGQASAAPTNLRFDAPTDSSCTVRWAAAAGATDYDVNYKPAVGGRWTNEPHRGTELYNTINDLESNTEYRWAVRAENNDGASEWIHGPNFMTLTEDQDEQDGGDAISDSLALVALYHAPAPSLFNIELVFADNISEEDREIFRQAAARWEEVITQGLPDIKLPFPVDRGHAVLEEGREIDDLLVLVRTEPPGDNIRWWASGYAQVFHRRESGLPAVGQVTYDENARAVLAEKYDWSAGNSRNNNQPYNKDPDNWVDLEILTIATHEIGHVLGIGTMEQWDSFVVPSSHWADPQEHNLFFNKGYDHEYEVEVSYFYTGPEAFTGFERIRDAFLEYYRRLGEGWEVFIHSLYYGVSVPLDDDMYHWHSQLESGIMDIMCSTLLGGGTAKKHISALTRGALVDLGYAVDMSVEVRSNSYGNTYDVIEKTPAGKRNATPAFRCMIGRLDD